jgi:hypothetical protein
MDYLVGQFAGELLLSLHCLHFQIQEFSCNLTLLVEPARIFGVQIIGEH